MQVRSPGWGPGLSLDVQVLTFTVLASVFRWPDSQRLGYLGASYVTLHEGHSIIIFWALVPDLGLATKQKQSLTSKSLHLSGNAVICNFAQTQICITPYNAGVWDGATWLVREPRWQPGIDSPVQFCWPLSVCNTLCGVTQQTNLLCLFFKQKRPALALVT